MKPKKSILSALALAAALGLAACAPTSTPRIRVAHDLGCTPEQTTIGRLDANRWQVTGCGKTAIYLCTYPVKDCWREGEIRSVSAAFGGR